MGIRKNSNSYIHIHPDEVSATVLCNSILLLGVDMHVEARNGRKISIEKKKPRGKANLNNRFFFRRVLA